MLDEAIASGNVNPDKVLMKRDCGDDQDPTAGSDQGKKKKRNGKDSDPSKDKAKMDVEEPILYDVVNEADQPQNEYDPKKGKPNLFKQSPRPATPDPEWNQDKAVDDGPKQTWLNDLLHKITKADLVRLVYKLLKGTCKSSIELEYNMDQCYNALTDQLDRINPESDRCPYDLSKPLTLKFGKEIHCINHQNKGCKVIDKQIVVRRVVRKLYTFKEGDFPNLHLNDIEDMLLLHVQKKLFNLDGDDIVDLAAALLMFTRRIIIQKGLKMFRVVYLDSRDHKKLMRADELYKFFDKALQQGPESDIHHGESDQQVAVRKKDHAKLGKIGRWRE
ncbi:hypothetical protein Tco_1511853, partial [Tanacetum coccineum]